MVDLKKGAFLFSKMSLFNLLKGNNDRMNLGWMRMEVLKFVYLILFVKRGSKEC